MRTPLRLLAFGALLASAGLALAQSSKPTISVPDDRITGRAVTAPALTNAPALATTNYTDGTSRAWLLIQNTNTTGSVIVYAGTTNTAPQATLAPGQSWSLNYPTIHSGPYSVGSADNTPRAVLCAEGWGR